MHPNVINIPIVVITNVPTEKINEYDYTIVSRNKKSNYLTTTHLWCGGHSTSINASEE